MGISAPAVGVPIGASLPYHGGVVPANFALLYGQTITRAQFPAVFVAFGIVGDTMVLPDSRGRSLVGKDDMGGTPANRVTSAGSGVDGLTLGAVGGGETVTVTQTTLPPHDHVFSANGNAGQATYTSAGAGSGSTPVAHVSSTGGGGAHNNMPPVLVANMMMRVI